MFLNKKKKKEMSRVCSAKELADTIALPKVLQDMVCDYLAPLPWCRQIEHPTFARPRWCKLNFFDDGGRFPHPVKFRSQSGWSIDEMTPWYHARNYPFCVVVRPPCHEAVHYSQRLLLQKRLHHPERYRGTEWE